MLAKLRICFSEKTKTKETSPKNAPRLEATFCVYFYLGDLRHSPLLELPYVGNTESGTFSKTLGHALQAPPTPPLTSLVTSSLSSHINRTPSSNPPSGLLWSRKQWGKEVLSKVLSHQPEKAMAPHSRTLAWKIPWTEEPGGLQSMGLPRVGYD